MHGMQNAMLLTYNFTLEGHTSAFVSQNVLAMAGLGSSLQSSLMMQNLYSVRTEIGQKKKNLAVLKITRGHTELTRIDRLPMTSC